MECTIGPWMFYISVLVRMQRQVAHITHIHHLNDNMFWMR